MKGIRCFAIAVGIAWPVLAFAQNQPTPSREDAERNAFQTPTAGNPDTPGQGNAGKRDAGVEPDSQAGAQNTSTTPEAKNADQSSKASSNGRSK
jgi:hypothetical protein